MVASVGRLQVYRESGSLLVVAVRQRRVVTKGTCFTFCHAQCAHTHVHEYTNHIHVPTHLHRRATTWRISRAVVAVLSPPGLQCLYRNTSFIFLLSSSSSLLLLLISLSPYTLVGRTNSFRRTRVIASDNGGNKRILFTPFDCEHSRHELCPRVRLGETNLI